MISADRRRNLRRRTTPQLYAWGVRIWLTLREIASVSRHGALIEEFVNIVTINSYQYG